MDYKAASVGIAMRIPKQICCLIKELKNEIVCVLIDPCLIMC